MEISEIRELLQPFCASIELSDEQLTQIHGYLDVLLLWNSKLSLSSVRNPALILQRHFGESIFAASVFSAPDRACSLMDIGSGAGFPGLPSRIARPLMAVTLVEAKAKRATFLREVIRRLHLSGATVCESSAEAVESSAEVVTLRAVEKFAKILPAAWSRVAAGGCLALMIGEEQVKEAESILSCSAEAVSLTPMSQGRVVALWRR